MTSLETEFLAARDESDLDTYEPPELSPEEYAQHTANMVANALEATKMFEVVEVKSGIGQVHVLGRVKRERERVFTQKVVHPVLVVMEADRDCNGFIGKQFLMKGGKAFHHMKYAWVFSFASNDLRGAASKVCRAFEPAVPRVEVVESPLMGPGTPQSGGQSTGRKGASPIS